MKKSTLVLALLAPMMLLSGCKKKGGGQVDPPKPPIPEITVTCNFYLDYNSQSPKTKYYTTTVQNGELIANPPANPTEAPFEEFPVFKGWSTSEIIDDDSKIWNFATDKVESQYSTLNFFGIWVALGD